MKKLPELRFDGFDGEWEEVQLGTEADVRDGTHDSPKYVNKGYPLITSKNIVNGKLNFNDISFISEEDFFLINKRSKVDIGDIIMPMIGTIGNPTILNRDDFAIKNVALIKKSNNLNNRFLLNLLNSKVFSKYLYRENAGGTQKFIALGIIREFLFNRPTIDEQEKIGGLFRKIDDLIEIQEDKVSKMRDYKKSMLQKTFPQKGELVPELRFDGFDGDWETTSIKRLGSFLGGTSIESEFNDFGEYKVISIGSYSESSKYIDQGLRVSLNYKTKSKLLEKDDLTMVLNDKTAKGNIIGRVLLIEESDKYAFNQRTQKISPDLDKYNSLFLYYLLNSNKFRDKIKRLAQGNTQIYINWSSIENLCVKIPSLKEQEKIGNFFKNLDTQIENEEKLLESYKMMKKSLLQKMFV